MMLLPHRQTLKASPRKFSSMNQHSTVRVRTAMLTMSAVVTSNTEKRVQSPADLHSHVLYIHSFILCLLAF